MEFARRRLIALRGASGGFRTLRAVFRALMRNSLVSGGDQTTHEGVARITRINAMQKVAQRDTLLDLSQLSSCGRRPDPTLAAKQVLVPGCKRFTLTDSLRNEGASCLRVQSRCPWQRNSSVCDLFHLAEGEVLCDSTLLASIVAPLGGDEKQTIWKVRRSFVMVRTTGCLTGGGHELVSEDSRWSQGVGLEQWCLLSGVGPPLIL
ncbi:hypothetical protein TNCV_1551961 [Trichonephila clavipes]|nr:hypothetical protein TNCV_1551961 [Trichonephila clavipes]